MDSVGKANEPSAIKYTMTLHSRYKTRLSISESKPRDEDSV